MLELTDNPEVETLDFLMAKDIAETLHAAYPGHLWAVTCEGEKGIATVRNMALAGNWGFVLHLNKFYSASDRKKGVVMAGGEILERYKLTRGRADNDAIATLACSPSGIIIGDKSK